MKTFLISILLVAFSSSVFCQQCPPSAMRIQSPICDTPKNLRVNVVNCTTAKLNWQGSKEQQYIVQATGTDDAGNTVFETKAADYKCNENGGCAATVTVQEGEKLNWNVQAICNISGVVIYSPVIEAKETIIPACNAMAANNAIAKTETDSKTIRVYPNPTTGKLTIEYVSNNSGNIQMVIYDFTGKQILNRAGAARKGTNTYQLNLANLSQGTYYLELNNAAQHSRVRFIIQR